MDKKQRRYLLAFVLIFSLALMLIVGLQKLLSQRIHAKALAFELKQTGLEQLCPNAKLGPWQSIPSKALPGVKSLARAKTTPRQASSAHLGQIEPCATVYRIETQSAYSAPIMLALIEQSGRYTALRVLQMKETPGVGTRILQGHPSWLEALLERYRSGQQPQRTDALSGATITSSAIIRALADFRPTP